MQQIPEELLALIRGGESHTVEFKRSRTEITKDVYETICAFSNRDGGHVFLGVKDNGEIIGVAEDKIDKIRKEFITSVNNENKMYPPLYLTPVEYEHEGKHILYIRVPISKDVSRCNGRIYDRNHESDFDITNHSDEVYRLYARKSGSHFVNTVYPAFHLADLRQDLIERAKRMTLARDQDHPWQNMTNEELIRSAGLILKDQPSGKEGITLAGILLFGTDQLIMSVLPQHKTDAIFRVYDTDRYDDRDVVITNLIESYDRLMAFGKKHLNDTFQLDGTVRVSPRDRILREIVSNLLVHRDFSNAYVAKLVIERDRIYTENANLSHGHGALNIASFEPFPKNPPISKVFREIGLADELGSGMRNTYKYTKMYSGAEPQFVEGDVFRIIIPLTEVSTATVGPSPTHFSESRMSGAEYGAINSENGAINGESGAINSGSGAINGVINSGSGAINGVINGKDGAIKLSKAELKLLHFLRQNPHATKREMVIALEIGAGTIDRGIKKLKQAGLLERIGSNKTGHWKVIDRIF